MAIAAKLVCMYNNMHVGILVCSGYYYVDKIRNLNYIYMDYPTEVVHVG